MKHALGWLMVTTLMCVPRVILADDDPVLQRVRGCALEPVESKRLACYDAALGRSETSDDVGLSGQLLRRKRQQAGVADATPKTVQSKVVAVSRPPAGKFVVTLENGQVWSQQELLDFPIEVGDQIMIRSGLLGALWLVDGHRNLETRVTRIR